MRLSTLHIALAVFLVTSVSAYPVPGEDGLMARQDDWQYLEARMGNSGSKSDTPTEKDRKDGNPPKYKDANKKPPPKYDPQGHPQTEFHSTHDPAAGTGRKDGSSRRRSLYERYLQDLEDLEARMGNSGSKSDTPTEKDRKDGNPPKYKDANKKPPPKYDPQGHPQTEFHSTHDPAAGTGRKDGSSRRRGLYDIEDLEARMGNSGSKSDTPTEKDRKDGNPPKYKDANKKPPPKYDPQGHPQTEFHSTHDPAAGTGRKDGSSRRRDLDARYLEDLEDLEARMGNSGSKSDTPTEKDRKDGNPPKYKDATKKPPPKYDPQGQPQTEFHSTHDPAAGTGRKDGSSRRRGIYDQDIYGRDVYQYYY